MKTKNEAQNVKEIVVLYMVENLYVKLIDKGMKT